MNWKLKSRVQNLVAALPSGLSYRVYYLLQRRCGGYRCPTPVKRLRAGVDILNRIRRHGRTADGKTFLEVGTGHQINVPIALWLGGAERIITVDLNPYLKAGLVLSDVAYIRRNRAEIVALFGPHARAPSFQDRLERLTSWMGSDLGSLLELLSVHYVAPADAARLPLPAASADYHVSFTVLEHVPPEALIGILREGRRVLAPSGLFVHFVDFTDHFSHSDSSITAMNFLRFTEHQWLRYGGSRYMYQNRLRLDDVLAVLRQSELDAIAVEPRVDARARQALVSGALYLDVRFRGKPVDINATADAWVVAVRDLNS